MNKLQILALGSAAIGTSGLAPVNDVMAQTQRSIQTNPGLAKNPRIPDFKNPPHKNPPSKNPPVKNTAFQVRVNVKSNVRPNRESANAIKCLQLFAGKVKADGIHRATRAELKSAHWCLQAFAKGLRK